MKKLLLLSVAVLAVFSLAFTACDSAVGPTTVTQGYSKIDNPKIQTKVYPGAVVVTWKPVKDAQSYTAVRIDNTTLRTTDLTNLVAAVSGTANSGGAVTLVDVVNYGNELVNGRSYTYVVTAYSSLNIGIAGNGVGTNPITGGSSEILPVLSGQSEATVKANVPATITFPTLAETNITLETFSNLNASEEFLKVSYPKIPDNQYNPGIGLQITYSYGSENTDKLPAGNYVVNASTDGAGYAVFPLIGGINTVNARYVWDKDNSTYANTFYTGPAAVTKVTENLAKTVLPATTTFAAALGTDGRAAPYMRLTYTYNTTFPSPELTGDITPVVYRAAVIGKSNVTSSLDTGTTVGGWTAVTTTWHDDTPIATSGQELTNYTRYAEDTTVERGNTYVYLLVLTTSTQTTVPAVSTAIPVLAVSPKAPTLSGFDAQVVQRLAANGTALNPVAYGIAVSWQGDATSTYKLYKAPNIAPFHAQADTIGTGANNAKPGDWAEVTAAKDALNKYYVFDIANLTARTSYFYKVVAVNDGIEITATDIAVGQSYSRAGGTLASGSGAISTSAIAGSWNGLTIGSGDIGFLLATAQPADANVFEGEEVRIYYWPEASSLQIGTTAYVTISKSNAENATASSRAVKASGALQNRTYRYATYIRLADETLLPITGSTFSSTVNVP